MHSSSGQQVVKELRSHCSDRVGCEPSCSPQSAAPLKVLTLPTVLCYAHGLAPWIHASWNCFEEQGPFTRPTRFVDGPLTYQLLTLDKLPAFSEFHFPINLRQ